MEPFHQSLRLVHIVSGCVGLMAFWFPLFSLKGGRFHKAAGTVFYVCAWVVVMCSSQRSELAYLITADHPPFAWWYKHMEGMIVAGIAFHTAFWVFAGQRLFSAFLTGPWQLIPWIGPAVIGSTALSVWTRFYRKQFSHKMEKRRADGSVRHGSTPSSE